MLILTLWGIGGTMIIFLAGLLDVPQQLYEAADIEARRAGRSSVTSRCRRSAR